MRNRLAILAGLFLLIGCSACRFSEQFEWPLLREKATQYDIREVPSADLIIGPTTSDQKVVFGIRVDMIERPYVHPADPSVGEEALPDTDTGILIKEVVPDRPASQIGLLPNDILIKVNNRVTDRISSLIRALAQINVGADYVNHLIVIHPKFQTTGSRQRSEPTVVHLYFSMNDRSGIQVGFPPFYPFLLKVRYNSYFSTWSACFGLTSSYTGRHFDFFTFIPYFWDTETIQERSRCYFPFYEWGRGGETEALL